MICYDIPSSLKKSNFMNFTSLVFIELSPNVVKERILLEGPNAPDAFLNRCLQSVGGWVKDVVIPEKYRYVLRVEKQLPDGKSELLKEYYRHDYPYAINIAFHEKAIEKKKESEKR